MTTLIFPGSFKPPHVGHFSLIKQLYKNPTINKYYIIISPKPRENITAEQSKKIWDIYLKLLKPNPNKKIYLIIAPKSSPITIAYSIVSKMKKHQKVLLIKSSKNSKNTRFESFKKLPVHLKVLELPPFKKLNATDMRKTIQNHNKKEFIKFLPYELNNNQKNKIWKILQK